MHPLVLFLILILASKDLIAQKFEPVAVIELFTSQGCSSCPPADRLVSEIVNEAMEKDQKVYALSFHVDYWDRLGWKDPYSSVKYTNRQKAYSRSFNWSTIYTPQMIVNGQVHFTGSKRNTALKEIDKALTLGTSNLIELSTQFLDQNQILVSYKIAGELPAKSVLNVALVERSITTQVKRGENGGRTLHQDNVVLVFESGKGISKKWQNGIYRSTKCQLGPSYGDRLSSKWRF